MLRSGTYIRGIYRVHPDQRQPGVCRWGTGPWDYTSEKAWFKLRHDQDGWCGGEGQTAQGLGFGLRRPGTHTPRTYRVVPDQKQSFGLRQGLEVTGVVGGGWSLALAGNKQSA